MNNQAVLDALTKASSQNTELLKEAEQQLKSWGFMPGYFSALLNIVADQSIDINIRWLSVLFVKNEIDPFWMNSISDEEKNFIRQKLLSCINQPVYKIALQIAVIISKIARKDYTYNNWPELLPFLVSESHSTDESYQLRILLTLHHVTKALASRRLYYHRQIFYEITLNILPTVLQHWINFSKLFLDSVCKDTPKSNILLEESFLALKILRNLVTYGFKDCSENTDAVNFISLIFQQMRPFLNCRLTLQNDDHMLELCEKYIVLLVKILWNINIHHPKAFSQFIQPSLECILTFCFNQDYKDYLFKRLAINLLNLFKKILDMNVSEYKQKEWFPKDVFISFFTPPALCEIIHQLISNYFLLSENDLQIWKDSPEEFASEDAGDNWQYSLRLCTECFFISLLRKFRTHAIPIVVEIIKSEENNTANDLMSILKKEAVYNVIGLAAFELYDEIDFENWLTSTLIPELQIQNEWSHILRRRIIWLIGQWGSVRITQESRPVAYEASLQMLKPTEDLIVRICASNTLKLLIDDFDFKQEQFLPFLERSISLNFQLLKEVKECDIKMKVLHVLSFIIERIGGDVQPYVNAVMHYLPELWLSSGDHNMLKCAVVSCFAQLVKSLRTASESIYFYILPIIAFCTDISQPAHVYLLEDGLALWWAIIQNASVCSPPLLNLASNLIPLLDFNSENLILSLQITEGYVVLYRESFLKKYGQDMVKTLTSAITDLKSEAVNKILKVVETALIVFPNDAPLLFQPLIAFALTKAMDPTELPISLSIYLSLISRVILHNHSCFLSILQNKAVEQNTDVNSVFRQLLDIWLDKMPLLNPVSRRKLMGLALTCILTSGSEVVHQYICRIYLSIVEVIHDVTKHDSNEDMLVFVQESEVRNIIRYVEDDVVRDEIESEHEKRMLKILDVDPVHTVVLRNYFYNQLLALQQSIGNAKFQDLMSKVDGDTMKEVTDLFDAVKV